jgi:MAternally-affected-uncoordination protein
MGQRAQALRQVAEALRLCDEDARLAPLHTPQLHCLLGVYSLSVGARDAALQQFNLCLKSTSDTDLWLYCAMNMALGYLAGMSATTASSSTSSQQQAKANLLAILDNILPDKVRTQNTALTAFSHYFAALKFYLSGQYQPAQSVYFLLTFNIIINIKLNIFAKPVERDSLREAILLANSENLQSIASNCLLFLGHISVLTNQMHESFQLLTNGVGIADKMPDLSLRTYAYSLLKGEDIY